MDTENRLEYVLVSILTAKDLGMHFGDQEVFKNVNFSIERGSKTAVLGENGSGKTTLIRIIMGTLYPTSGWLRLEDLDQTALKVGYVPQFRDIDLDYPLSIRSFVELNAPLFKSTAYKNRVDQVIDKTNLTEIQNYRLGRASGGQKQRAYLAQALIDQPDLIILDEATASLDPVAKESLLSLLDKLNQEDRLTILFTTHDLELAKQHMDNYILFSDKTTTTGMMADLGKESLNV